MQEKARSREEKGKNPSLPVSSSKALRIALEDPQMLAFMLTSFARPEQRPTIISQTRLDGFGKWRVALIENLPSRSGPDRGLVNIALFEVHGESGKILERRFFRNLLAKEVRTELHLCIHHAGCKGRSR